MLFYQLIIIINIHPDFENLKHMKCSGKKTQASTWKEKFYKELKRFWAYFINSSIFLSGSKHLPHDNKMEDIFERDQFNVPNYIIIQKKKTLLNFWRQLSERSEMHTFYWLQLRLTNWRLEGNQ